MTTDIVGQQCRCRPIMSGRVARRLWECITADSIYCIGAVDGYSMMMVTRRS